MKTTPASSLWAALRLLFLLLLPPAGFAAPDLWMRDDPSDTGAEPNNISPILYLSDDIWVRRLPDPNYDPEPFPTASPTWVPLPHEGPCYRDPKTSSPNYLYVRVRNRGNTASAGTETLHVYWAKASTGLGWPGDWNDHLADPCGTGTPRLYGYEVTKPRKNGATASVAERNDYVAAIQTIDTAAYQFPDGVTYYDKQNLAHTFVFTGINNVHGTLQFFPWHREMIGRYEALLREVKPALTLLYWDWTTDPAPTIVNCNPSSIGCTVGYMGFASGVVAAPFTTFGISRTKPAGAPGAAGLQPIYQSNTILPSADYATLWGNVEVPAHNSAHGHIGGTVTSFNAVRDPMFFMIHANCDRVWAMWQRKNSANVDPWTPSQAYDASQGTAAINTALKPWDGSGSISPWQNQVPGDPNGYVIMKPPTHHSIVYPPTYDDVQLKIPILDPGECCIIEIPFYPPRRNECPSFNDPQHLCLLARIEPMPAPAEGADLWQNVKDHNNIAWRNVTLSDCNVGPFFLVRPGRIGAAAQLIRNFRDVPMVISLRFQEARAGFRSLFEYGPVRLRLSDTLYAAWLRGGRQGQGVETSGTNEVLVYGDGAALLNIPLDKREVGYMDLGLELNRNYQHPFGDVYHLDVLQYEAQGENQPVGGQRYDLDFNSLPIVRKGADWKYLDGGKVPPANWFLPTFDDQSWGMGTAPFGYGRSDVATGLRGTSNGQPATVYFRHEFDAPDPTFYTRLALNYLQDDGLIVYLNGQEIARANMPTGAVNSATRALSAMTGAAARACRTLLIGTAANGLIRGPNLLAVEVHPGPSTSNPVDLTHDLELAGNVPDYPYQTPTVVIATPRDGSLVRFPSDVPILADVVDPDGDLGEVRIFADGQILARLTGPPYMATFRPTSLGAHRISVEAEDFFSNRSRMESVFTMVSNLIPVVNMAGPPNGTVVPNGQPVLLSATAGDPDGTVTQVVFYVRAVSSFLAPHLRVGADSSAPYMVPVSGLAPDHYLAVAEARDNLGATGYSLATHFTVSQPPGTPDLRIRFQNIGGARVVTVEWDDPTATLQRAGSLPGQWETLSQASSPWPIQPDKSTEFYQLVFPPTHVH